MHDTTTGTPPALTDTTPQPGLATDAGEVMIPPPRDLAVEAQLIEDELSSARRRGREELLRVNLLRLLLLAAFLALWEFASGRLLDPFFFSSPLAILAALDRHVLGGDLLWHLQITVYQSVSGYGIGVVVGVLSAVVVASMKRVYAVVEPFVLAVYGIPRIALAPLFIIWFGIGMTSKVLIAAFMVFFVVFMNTVAGFQAADRGLIAVSRLMGANRLTLLVKVMLPSATPYIMTALRIAVPTAVIGAVVGEFISSTRGIGFFISRASFQLDIASAFAAIFMLMIVILLMNGTVNLIDKRFMRWREGV